MSLPNATAAMRGVPAELRVRVKIGDCELPSLASASEARWDGVALGVQTAPDKTDMGRTNADAFRVRVPLASVAGAEPPDNCLVGIMYAGETVFTNWRLRKTQRTNGFLMMLDLGPLYG